MKHVLGRLPARKMSDVKAHAYPPVLAIIAIAVLVLMTPFATSTRALAEDITPSDEPAVPAQVGEGEDSPPDQSDEPPVEEVPALEPPASEQPEDGSPDTVTDDSASQEPEPLVEPAGDSQLPEASSPVAPTVSCSAIAADVVWPDAASFACTVSDGPAVISIGEGTSSDWSVSTSGEPGSYGKSVALGPDAGTYTLHFAPDSEIASPSATLVLVASSIDPAASGLTSTAIMTAAFTLPPVPDPQPAIACALVDITANAFDCVFRPDTGGANTATGGSLILDVPEGWSATVGDAPYDPAAGVALARLGDVAAPMAIRLTFAPLDACMPAGTMASAAMHVDYVYATSDGGSRAAAATDPGRPLTLTAPVIAPSAPTLALSDIEFGSLSWDGSGWVGAGAQTLSIAVAREPCGGNLGSYDISLSIPATEATGFLVPHATGATATGEGIAADSSVAIGAGESATIATVDASFAGQGSVSMPITIAPSNEALAGDFGFTIEVWTEATQ